MTDQLDREARGTLETVSFTWEPDGESWGQARYRVKTAHLGISGWQIDVEGHAEVQLSPAASRGLPEAHEDFHGSVGDMSEDD
ncbi:hypothetical protein ASG71_07970 [Arthrobacter sp. Soil763]|nr:hypothetical protein ASG71_07970 [Arthrobacter sp. Soil763]